MPDEKTNVITLNGTEVGTLATLNSKSFTSISNAAQLLPASFGAKCVSAFFTFIAKMAPRKMNNLLAGYVTAADVGITTWAGYNARWKFLVVTPEFDDSSTEPFQNGLLVPPPISDQAVSFLRNQTSITTGDGSALSDSQFMRGLVGFLVARTHYIRRMGLDALTSKRELMKSCFQLGADSTAPAGHYTESLAVVCALTSTAVSKLGPEQDGLRKWLHYHCAWINAAVIAGLASSSETDLAAMQESCKKNEDTLLEVSRMMGLSTKALIFDKIDRILDLMSKESLEDCELRDIADRAVSERSGLMPGRASMWQERVGLSRDSAQSQLRLPWLARTCSTVADVSDNYLYFIDAAEYNANYGEFCASARMRLRLHPVHRQEESEVLQNCASRHVQDLERCLARLARQKLEADAAEEEIQISGTSILLLQKGQLVLRIPLLLADVAYRAFETHHGRSSFLLGVLPRSRSPEGYGNAWIFLVGPCSDTEFHHHLWQLGRHGVLRRDVDQALSVSEKVLGAGGCGKVFLAKCRPGTARRPRRAKLQVQSKSFCPRASH
ncbi:unnamed protein product [Durusdinium trenchii]|uniref:Uncharacterized protein n=1 Tax=Durusdinium trenchii TaxID=1381693 RepID=A0ABP0P0Q6_9DINO